MCKLTPKMIDDAKQMIVNLEVAKTMDRKTHTRRLIKDDMTIQLDEEYKYSIRDNRLLWNEFKTLEEFIKFASKFQAGDIFWIREPVKVTRFDDILQQYDYQYVSDGKNVYQADIPKKYKGHNNPKWMKNLHRVPNGCLKTMARTFIKITNVRVERLQDISSEDIEKEGFVVDEHHKQFGTDLRKYRDWWINLWNSTALEGYKWEDNPYVFVYEFEVVKNGK